MKFTVKVYRKQNLCFHQRRKNFYSFMQDEDRAFCQHVKWPDFVMANAVQDSNIDVN